MSRTADRDLAEILAERGRPVGEEGLARARARLAEGDASRDLDARELLKERLRSTAS